MNRCEVAHALGVTPRSLDRWTAAGRGPRRFRLANRCVYSRCDVEQWLALRRAETGRGGAA
ncbi:MAG: DNA-binding protein [Gammaproteobacteria bacterium HGW-Gammaproteobacteria-2]|nr:MAG: DNA-binding protein [Gammaproteobacteria bacterium HGW-Gammaproteobacteria-2]